MFYRYLLEYTGINGIFGIFLISRRKIINFKLWIGTSKKMYFKYLEIKHKTWCLKIFL